MLADRRRRLAESNDAKCLLFVMLETPAHEGSGLNLHSTWTLMFDVDSGLGLFRSIISKSFLSYRYHLYQAYGMTWPLVSQQTNEELDDIFLRHYADINNMKTTIVLTAKQSELCYYSHITHLILQHQKEKKNRNNWWNSWIFDVIFIYSFIEAWRSFLGPKSMNEFCFIAHKKYRNVFWTWCQFFQWIISHSAIHQWWTHLCIEATSFLLNMISSNFNTDVYVTKCAILLPWISSFRLIEMGISSSAISIMFTCFFFFSTR